MPQSISAEAYDILVEVVAQYPEGATREDIAQLLVPRPPEPTLSLMLEVLVTQQRLEMRGSGDAQRYFTRKSDAQDAQNRVAEVESTKTSGEQTEAHSGAGDATASDVTRDQLVDALIPAVVKGEFSRRAAMRFLQQQAKLHFESTDAQRAFVAYGLKRFDALTVADAGRYVFTPAQFEAWRQQYLAKEEVSGEDGRQQTEQHAAEGEPADGAAKKKRAKRPTEPATPGQVVATAIDAWLKSAVAGPSSSASPTGTDIVVPKRSINAVGKFLGQTIGRLMSAGPLVTSTLTALFGSLGYAAIRGLSVSLPLVVPVCLIGFVAVAWMLGGNASDGSAVSQWTPRKRYAVAATCVGLVALVVGVLWYWNAGQRPSDSVVKAYLATSLAPLPVQVPKVDVTPLRVGNAGCTLSFQARVVVTESLYRRVDTAEYLRTHFRNEVAAIDAATALLSGPNGARLRTALRDAPPSGNGDATSSSRKSDDHATGRSRLQIVPSVRLHDVVLLTTETAAGREVLTSGQLNGMGHGSDWSFDATGWYNRPRFSGERKPAGPGVFVSDNPADMARLMALVADEAAYAATVQATATALAAELERDRQKRVEGFEQLLRPGTLFTGAIVDNDYGGPLRIVIEVTDSSPTTHHVSALVRNDGGWSDARSFQGEWTVDAEAEACTLQLETRTGDLISKGGPLLEDYGRRSLSLRIRPDGSAVGTPGNGPFIRVDATGAAAVKAELMRPITDALAATKPGLVYRGTPASAKATTWQGEPLILRFTEQGPDGVTLRATLESTSHAGWVRAFRGTIIGNTYRASRNPIQLTSADSERIAQADQKSPLGFYSGGNNFALSLRAEGKRLVLDDGRYGCSFEQVEAANAEKLTTEMLKSESAKTFAGRAGVPSPAVGNTTLGEPKADAPAEPKSNPTASTPAEFQHVSGSAFPNLPAPFPTASGAYVLANGGWIRLPQNRWQFIQTTEQALAMIDAWDNHVASKSTKAPSLVAANLSFDGTEAVPAVPGNKVVIVYIGPWPAPSAEQLERYPELRTYPAIELAPLKTVRGGVRTAPLYAVAPGLFGFGVNRVPATIEQPREDVTILRCTASLGKGRYALWVGPVAFEVEVQ